MYDFTKQYETRILVRGRPVTEYHHTDGNIYVEGRKGSDYSLEFANNSAERICILPAVDGLSVMDGKPAGLDSDGYVVNAYSSLKIPGWRLDNNKIAKFAFSDIGGSYARTSGRGTSNVGVIGFMVFRENIYYNNSFGLYGSSDIGSASFTCDSFGLDSIPQNGIMSDSISLGSSADTNIPLNISPKGRGSVNITGTQAQTGSMGTTRAAKASLSANVKPELGTKFGNVSNFQTHDVEFEKRDGQNPDAMIVIYYDSARGLEKRGIRLVTKRSRGQPSAFPGYKGRKETGCMPPANWHGRR